MRQISVCLFSLLVSTFALAGSVEAQDYSWVKNLGLANPINLDVQPGSTNVYVGGNFYGTTDFNPGSGTANLASAGSSDAFIAKYNASGNYVWAKRVGGSGFEIVNALETDSSGNVYAFGTFSGTVDFNPGSGVNNLTASGLFNAFILKLNSSGTYQWAKRIGGTSATFPKGIQRDTAGNLVVVGLFNGTVDFNPGSGTNNLTATNTDAFFAKYNSSGNYVWAKRIDGSGQLLDPGMALDGSNNVHVTGSFSGTVNVIGATLSGSGSQNLYVVKYNSSGNRVWSRVITGATGGTNGASRPLAVDSSGNVYRIGHFSGSVSFGGQTVSSAGNLDVMLAKYNSSGTAQWIRRMGGSQDDTGEAVVTDSAGDLYISGSYWGNGDWDPGSGTRTLTHKGNSDIYFGKYTSGGNLIWAHGLGSPGNGPITGNDDLDDITVDSFNNVYINGLLGGSVDFNLGSGTANASGRGFFAKYTQAGGGSGCVTPPSNMEAWYSFDSTSVVEDLAGSNNGVRVGPVATTGKVAGAYDFDGSNDYVYVNDNSALDFGTGDFSIDAWIKTTDSNATFVSKRQLTGGKYVGYLFMVNGGRLLLQMGDTTNSWFNYHSSSTPRVDDGQWHLVAVTVDRSSSSGGRMYIDGNLVYTFNPTGRSGNTSNSARLEIGRTTGGGNYFDGAIDEVELFDRALSASEITGLWNAGADGKCKSGGGTPDPLSVILQCLSTTEGDFHGCLATPSGGSGGNSFSWSYIGDGFMTPSGNSANVTINNCNGGLNVITVNVTDNSGASASAQKLLACTSCGSFICED